MLYLLAAGGGENGPISPMDFANPANHAAGLWALGIFLVLLLVLLKFAWGPITAGLAAREERINESLEKAQAIEKATRELQATNQKMLDDAQREAQGIIATARQTAQATANELAAKAQAEIDAQRERGKRELRLEADKARAMLREEAVELTLQATAKLIGKSLSGDDQRRLAQEALADAESVARN
jgi:F-type H+-transporting ATPase subunit b